MSADQKQKEVQIKVIVVFSFITMVVVNALANIIPINNVTTGEISEIYNNLFAPAGITFAIWGLIYLLLSVYCLYHLGVLKSKNKKLDDEILGRIALIFSVSSLANAAWIFSWHYDKILLSMLLMVVILVCLVMINNIINASKLSLNEKLFLKLPFSVYFGWITVATVANATVLLVSLGWDGFGISEAIWTVLILVIALIIGAVIMLKNKDTAYGLVFIWAYLGILIRHVSENELNGKYPLVIGVLVFCLITLAVIQVVIIYNKRKKSNI